MLCSVHTAPGFEEELECWWRCDNKLGGGVGVVVVVVVVVVVEVVDRARVVRFVVVLFDFVVRPNETNSKRPRLGRGAVAHLS